MTFALKSPAFEDGQEIPQKYVRAGQNLSPPLFWEDAPEGTRSFLLSVEDPDAPRGVFRHWAVYDMTPECTRLSEGATAGAKTESLAQGINDFGNACYDGPQPPKGHGVHHYHFRLAALDVETLHCEQKPAVADLLEAASPHVIATADLVGTYETP